MFNSLQKLINDDTIIDNYTDASRIIIHGLAPIRANKNRSLQIQKANLLEQAKLNNWKLKSSILFKIFRTNKINFIVFKGFAYTHYLYNNTYLRPYCDIDIFIDKKDYDKVHHIFSQLNYHCFPTRQGQFISFQNSYYDDDNPQTVFDLHWQINNRIEFHQYFPFNELFKNSIKITTSTISFLTLNLMDTFIIGCFHYQAHRPEDRKHIWLYDLALLWLKMTTIEQSECLKKAELCKQYAIISSTLILLTKVFPNMILLTHDKTLSKDEATSHYLHKRSSKIGDIFQKFKNIYGIKNKIIFISEYLFQSRTYVKHRFNLKSNTFIFFYYPKMWIEDIRKLFKK